MGRKKKCKTENGKTELETSPDGSRAGLDSVTCQGASLLNEVLGGIGTFNPLAEREKICGMAADTAGEGNTSKEDVRGTNVKDDYAANFGDAAHTQILETDNVHPMHTISDWRQYKKASRETSGFLRVSHGETKDTLADTAVSKKSNDECISHLPISIADGMRVDIGVDYDLTADESKLKDYFKPLIPLSTEETESLENALDVETRSILEEALSTFIIEVVAMSTKEMVCDAGVVSKEHYKSKSNVNKDNEGSAEKWFPRKTVDAAQIATERPSDTIYGNSLEGKPSVEDARNAGENILNYAKKETKNRYRSRQRARTELSLESVQAILNTTTNTTDSQAQNPQTRIDKENEEQRPSKAISLEDVTVNKGVSYDTENLRELPYESHSVKEKTMAFEHLNQHTAITIKEHSNEPVCLVTLNKFRTKHYYRRKDVKENEVPVQNECLPQNETSSGEKIVPGLLNNRVEANELSTADSAKTETEKNAALSTKHSHPNYQEATTRNPRDEIQDTNENEFVSNIKKRATRSTPRSKRRRTIFKVEDFDFLSSIQEDIQPAAEGLPELQSGTRGKDTVTIEESGEGESNSSQPKLQEDPDIELFPIDDKLNEDVTTLEESVDSTVSPDEEKDTEDTRQYLPLLPDYNYNGRIVVGPYLEGLDVVYSHWAAFNKSDLKLRRIVTGGITCRTYKGWYKKNAVEVMFCHRNVPMKEETDRFLKLESPFSSRILAYLSGDIMCFVYAYMRFGSLAALMAENNRRGFIRILHAECLLYGLLKGVGYLADNDIIHANICPKNVLLNDNGHPVISNFTWAYLCDSGPVKSRAEEQVEVAYAAPERLSPNGLLTPAVDIFSVGCVVYAIVVGSPPFSGNTEEETISNILDRSLMPNCGPHLFGWELSEVINSCLSKRLSDRMTRGKLVRKYFLDGYQSTYLGTEEPSALLPVLHRLYGDDDEYF